MTMTSRSVCKTWRQGLILSRRGGQEDRLHYESVDAPLFVMQAMDLKGIT